MACRTPVGEVPAWHPERRQNPKPGVGPELGWSSEPARSRFDFIQTICESKKIRFSVWGQGNCESRKIRRFIGNNRFWWCALARQTWWFVSPSPRISRPQTLRIIFLYLQLRFSVCWGLRFSVCWGYRRRVNYVLERLRYNYITMAQFWSKWLHVSPDPMNAASVTPARWSVM